MECSPAPDLALGGLRGTHGVLSPAQMPGTSKAYLALTFHAPFLSVPPNRLLLLKLSGFIRLEHINFKTDQSPVPFLIVHVTQRKTCSSHRLHLGSLSLLLATPNFSGPQNFPVHQQAPLAVFMADPQTLRDIGEAPQSFLTNMAMLKWQEKKPSSENQ